MTDIRKVNLFAVSETECQQCVGCLVGDGETSSDTCVDEEEE